MTVQDNPYQSILQTMRSDSVERQHPPWRIGVVKTANPLVVVCCGLALGGGELQMDSRLRQEKFLPGERVAMLTAEDDSSFIILCKVVTV